MAQLDQRHPSVDCNELRRLSALYRGGKEFEAQLAEFLPQRPQEPATRYEARKREAHYRNYLGPIVDFFATLLFTQRPIPEARKEGSEETTQAPADFYPKFREDCDRNGTDVDAFFKDRLIWAAVQGHSWMRLHQPVDGGEPPTDAADFEARALGEVWLSGVDAESVYDWEVDDSGRLLWAVTHGARSDRPALGAGRDQITETWEHLQRDRVDTYSITYERAKPPNREKTDVPLRNSVPHTFGSVPLHLLELPDALHVGNRLQSPQLAHFRLSNAQTWGMAATCYAMPVVKVKDPDAFQQQTMGSGYGFTIEPDEAVEWTSPPAAPFDALSSEIAAHKDEIFRIAQQLAMGVNNNAAAVGRSADSKRADAEATRVVLVAFARATKEAIERVYDAISRLRGENLIWSIGGMDDFASADLQGLVETLETAEKSGGIPSKTFQVQMKTRLAEALLPDLDEKLKKAIREEIEAGISDQSDDAKEEREMRRLDAMTRSLEAEGQQAKRPPGKPPPNGQQQAQP